MTAYYVRKTGNNASAGTSPGAAWLTIGKALTGGMASGDTVYVGAGTYRESVTITVAPTATTSVIGDVDGSKTGDAGEVRWTAFTTNDTTIGAAFTCKTNGKNFWSMANIHFVGGTSTNCVDGASVAGSHDWTLTNCAFTPGAIATAQFVYLVGPVDAAANYTLDRCWFGVGGNGFTLRFDGPTSTTADYDQNIVVKNSVFFSGQSGGGIELAASGANSFKPGGGVIQNCTFLGGTVISVSRSQSMPTLISNSVLDTWGGAGTFCVSGNGAPCVVEDYNLLYNLNNGILRNGVGIGSFSAADARTYAQLASFGQETVWGGQARPPGVPLAGSPWLGYGNAALAAGRTPTCTDDATVGTIAWTTPANASVPDGTKTTASTLPATTGVSHYLMAQGFTGFAGIPSNATIKSIRVEVFATASAGASVSCSSIKLLKAGVIQGNDLASGTTTQFAVALGSVGPISYGTSADPLWGTTWTVAQVQAAGFGCVFSAKNVNAATRDCSVDFVRVIVAYTLVDGSGGVATDMLGGPRPAGGNSLLYAVGAFERGNTAVVQSVVEHTASTPCWNIAGPGYNDFYADVDSGVTFTLGVWAQYDTAAQQPTITVKANPALGINADTLLTWSDPGTNTWGQFTTSLSPTASGIIQVRCATAVGTGNAYFADVSFV